ncbi:hypothetical protein ACXET9_08485 [Brachybacterium sp. DNPG3]
MTETASAPEPNGAFPYGVGRAAGPDAPIEHTPYDAASALAVLERAADADPADGAGPVEAAADSADGGSPADGAGPAEEIITLTDEQLLGVEGHRRPQPVALPWATAQEETGAGARELLAAAGLRSLMAADLVVAGQDRETGERRWLVDPAVNGCLVLRRTARVIASAERQVRSEAGVQEHRLYYYVHPEGVLEEEVTASGMHIFRSLRRSAVPGRLALLIDQDRVAADDGSAPLEVSAEDLAAGGPVAARLADARAITVVSSLGTRTDEVKQLIMYATTTELLAQQTEEGADGEAEVTLKSISRTELLDLGAWFVDPGAA